MQSFHRLPQPKFFVRAITRLLPLALCLIGPTLGCIGDDGFVNEPDFGPELLEPEPGPDFECFDDRECEEFFGPEFFCSPQGFCEFGSDECESNFDCEPFVCNRFEGACDVCSDSNPCPLGLFCLNDGSCSESPPLQTAVDFDVDVMPLFTSAGCIACHHTDAPVSSTNLVFDVSDDLIYDQLLLPARGRVVVSSPETSSVITKPRREDPPDHPVGTWDADGPEIALLTSWIRGGAPRVGACREVAVSNGATVNCVVAYQPENYCSVFVVDNAINDAVVAACGACDALYFDAPDGLTCPTTDAGPGAPDDGGGIPDAGPAPDDGGGIPDAGPAADGGGGIPDAGLP